MKNPFFHSSEALEADSPRRLKLTLGLVWISLIGWGIWMLGSSITLYRVTSHSQLQMDTAQLCAPVAGRVVFSRLQVGARVEREELMLDLDAEPQMLELRELEAQKTAMNDLLRSLQREIQTHRDVLARAALVGQSTVRQAVFRQREEKIWTDFVSERSRRLEALKDGGFIPELDRLKIQGEAEKGKAALETLRIRSSWLALDQHIQLGDRASSLERLVSEAIWLEGQVASLSAAITRLQATILLRQLRAPIAGRVAEVTPIQIGAFANEGECFARIASPDDLKVVAHFAPSSSLGRLQPGQPARVRFPGFPWTQFGYGSATVARVANEFAHGQVRVELAYHPDPLARIPIQHGLPADTEVEVGRCSPWDLLLRTLGAR